MFWTLTYMKLFQINSTLNWGSTGRIAEEIGQTAISKGWESYIAYGRYSNGSVSHTIQIGSRWNVYNHFLRTRLFDNHGLASKRATKDLINQIENINPDVIHLHNIHGYYLNYKLLFDFFSCVNKPIVWTLHDCWSFTGHCSYYSYVGCNRWQTLCNDCPQKRSYPISWLLDRSEQNYRDKIQAFTSVKKLTLVPVSNWLAGEIKQSFLKDYPIKVIHNGIDTDTFVPRELNKVDLGLEDRFLILGIASVWSSRKGLADFIELRKFLPDDYSIVLIGLDEKQIRSLPKGIVGIKRTNSVGELAAYYSLSDVYFNPTWEDNFPIVNLEALACGTPVITYRTGGSVEAVDENTGFIVEQGDIISVTKIVQLIKEKGKGYWTSICRERATSLYDKRKRYLEYIHLYEKLVNL